MNQEEYIFKNGFSEILPVGFFENGNPSPK
jgi:hypothetical protein